MDPSPAEVARSVLASERARGVRCFDAAWRKAPRAALGPEPDLPHTRRERAEWSVALSSARGAFARAYAGREPTRAEWAAAELAASLADGEGPTRERSTLLA